MSHCAMKSLLYSLIHTRSHHSSAEITDTYRGTCLSLMEQHPVTRLVLGRLTVIAPQYVCQSFQIAPQLIV